MNQKWKLKMTVKASKSLFAFLLVSFIVSSCGYYIESFDKRFTLFVPFIEGDVEGTLTSEVIYQLASSTHVEPSSECGKYRLEVCIDSTENRNVGFRYDTTGQGALTNYVIPQETELKICATVTLYERGATSPISGPSIIVARTVFDHNWYSSPNEVNVFSLGQLTDYSDGKDAALSPLYRKLAQNIADWVEMNIN